MTETPLPEPIEEVTIPIQLDYVYTPGRSTSLWLRGLAEGRLIALQCPSCEKIYAGARGLCPMCGEMFLPEPIEVGPNGTVVTFAVVNVPSKNIDLELPYVSAEVLLDGSHTRTFFLLRGVTPDEVRMGMRVRTVWKDESEWEPTLANIKYVEPIDEPDAPFESIQEFV